MLEHNTRMLQLARDGDVISVKGLLDEEKAQDGVEVKKVDKTQIRADILRVDLHSPDRYTSLHWACYRNHSKLALYPFITSYFKLLT